VEETRCPIVRNKRVAISQEKCERYKWTDFKDPLERFKNRVNQEVGRLCFNIMDLTHRKINTKSVLLEQEILREKEALLEKESKGKRKGSPDLKLPSKLKSTMEKLVKCECDVDENWVPNLLRKILPPIMPRRSL
jgi:hypothetical protein